MTRPDVAEQLLLMRRAARRNLILREAGLDAWRMRSSSVPSGKRYRRKPKHAVRTSPE